MNEKCDTQIENLLVAYFSGKTTPPEEEKLWEWLQSDPTHAAIWQQKSEEWALMHSTYFMEKEEVDWQRVRPLAARQTPFQLWWQRGWKVAASLLLLLGMGLASYQFGLHQTQQKMTSEVKIEVTTPPGSRSEMTLPDGTHVFLNAGSHLSYRFDAHQQQRMVFLNGEAYFDVNRDTLRPFVVETSGLSVKVLGTKFNVRAYANDLMEDVALLSGHVEVWSTEINEPVELLPNNRLSLDRSTSGIELSTFEGEDMLAWMQGELKFSRQTFEEIAKTLERKFGVSIRIESPTLAEESFSGGFPAEYTLEQILQDVDVEHRYTWQQQKNVWIIRDRMP